MPGLKRESSPVHQPLMFDWASACGTPVGMESEEDAQEREPVGEPPVPVWEELLTSVGLTVEVGRVL